MYKIFLAKEPFKFSCSHFTILSADRAERLHGHNYQVRVEIACDGVDPDLGMAFDYNEVKPLIRAFCDRLDERILVPTRSPYLKIETRADQSGGGLDLIDVRFGPKHYTFPAEDVILLEISNVTCEELARVAGEHLVARMEALPLWTAVELHVEETRGQSVGYTIKRRG